MTETNDKTNDGSIITDEVPVMYFSIIPNMIFDEKGIPAAAKFFYSYLRRVAGESGECWKSIKTMNEETGIGENSLRKYKKLLARHGLIRITPGNYANSETDRITLVNIWQKNFQQYSKKQASQPSEEPTPPHDSVTPPLTEQTPPPSRNRELKNNPIKNNPVKNINTDKAVSPPVTSEPDSIKENKNAAAYELGKEIAKITNIDYGIRSQTARIIKVAKDLMTSDTDPDMESFSRWWYRYDWRGKRGQPPTPEQIPQAWGAYKAALHRMEEQRAMDDPEVRRKLALAQVLNYCESE